MTNKPNPMPAPDLSTMTHIERLMYFSSAKSELIPLDRPVKRPPPKSRRNSVKHRAIR